MNVVDLFAGGGGLSLGFQNAGYNIVAAFDNWDPAVSLYRRNFKDHPIYKWDMNRPDSVQKISSFKPDMIVGGPPCQDFSSAGKRDETLGRADLTIVFSKVVAEVKPKYFLMENVDRAYKSNVYAISKDILSAAGYGLTDVILNASYCGVPQSRKRLFLFGELNGENNALLDILLKNQSKEKLTLRDYFGDSLGVEFYYRHPRSYKRRGIFSVDEPSPTIRGVNRPIPKGYKGHPGDKSEINQNVRPLTTRERALIQTFPPEFILEGSKTDLEQIIGNAVPVRLAQYVAESINLFLGRNVKLSGSVFDFIKSVSQKDREADVTLFEQAS
ncbi:MAG: DNA cytosine methyltransferase [Chlorobi bacterium]|nr:DNA cytosine methyltransferase [Chlorobiota bacterium]